MFRPAIISTALSFALSLSLSACGPQDPDFGTPPEALEGISVERPLGIAQSLRGTLGVTGSERDFVLSIADGEVTHTIKVHSPAQSDLAALDGKDLTIGLGDSELSRPGLLIRDDAGVVYYAYSGHDVEGAAAAGVPVGNFGEPVARVTMSDEHSDIIREYTPVVFSTDEGDVSLLPGEVKSIRHGGKTFRAAVVASYSIRLEGAEVACPPSSHVAYELLRVDAPLPTLKLVRPTHLMGASAPSCAP